MRPRRREPRRVVTPPRRRRTTVPKQSRVSVSRAVASLRRSREALSDIQGQLDALLLQLKDAEAHIDAGAPERLIGATRQAGRALLALNDLRRFLP
jgi:hypothetical protein